MPRKKKPVEKKVIKERPKHPRPLKGVRWSERREDKPSYKRKRKRKSQIEKELLEE
ncbi:hypothetical protein JXM67_13740 [candidate division WOR-3 bacterium]|nr:hypothetical protein [candidate division WOR-3 bacterium]